MSPSSRWSSQHHRGARAQTVAAPRLVSALANIFRARAGRRQPEQERIARLEKKIQIKDEVLAELMAEHVALKKSLGEL